MKQFQRLFKVEGSYMQVAIVFGTIVLVLIIMNEATSACRFLKSGMFICVGFYCSERNCSGFDGNE